MKALKILFMTYTCLVAGLTTRAQVTIGTLKEPHRGAVLHLCTSRDALSLSASDTLGLKLTVTDLPDTIRLNLGNQASSQLDVDPTATGMVVYNRTLDVCKGLVPCLYVWDGATWHPVGCSLPSCIAPLTASYQIDGCVALMYTYQTQTLRAVATTPVDDGKMRYYQWRERYRVNGGIWSVWSNVSATDSVYEIPPFRFDSPMVSTSDLIEAQYECIVSNTVTSPISALMHGSNTATITFVHLGTDDEIHAKAAANSGLIPVKLNTGSGAGDTLIVAHANLGAELDSINDGIMNDACDLGDLYQWGRQKDGHQRVTWHKNSSNQIEVDASQSAAGYNRTATALTAADYGTDHQVLPTSAAYGKFIYGSNTINWTASATDSENLWRGNDKTASDPCPYSWRVMNKEEASKLYNASIGTQVDYSSPSANLFNRWTQSSAGSFTRTLGGGYTVTSQSDARQNAILLAAGVRDRNSGIIGTAFSGEQGRLWTSSDEPGGGSALVTNNNLMAHSFSFNDPNLWTDDVNSSSTAFNKTDGRGVRCVKFEPDICYDSSTKGTEFYVAFGNNYSKPVSKIYLAVDISAETATTVSFTYTFDGTTVSQSVAAGTVYRFEPVISKLYPEYAYPIPGDENKTLKITSDQPISVYAFNTSAATTDATIVLPTASWGKSYFSVSYQPMASEYAQQMIVAKEDNTTVTVYSAGGVAESPVTLQEGQVYFYSGNSGQDLTGTSVIADKTIGVFSHTTLSQIPTGRIYADIMYEQMLSVERWGKKFLVPNARQGSNSETNRIRILASQYGTNVSYSGATLITGVAGATSVGATLDAAQFVELKITSATGKCYITSDKPVAVCSYLTGGGGTMTTNVTGDPAMAWVPALDQIQVDALIQPFMFPYREYLSYTNLDATYQNTPSEAHHYAIIIAPTDGKNATTVTVNGTTSLLSSIWAGDSWTDDASSGYSFLIHEFDNINDINGNFLFQNASGLLVLAYGFGTVESYYYNAASGTCLRGIYPVYHGLSKMTVCPNVPASFPEAPYGYTYSWSPSELSNTEAGHYTVTVTDNISTKQQTYTNALVTTVGTCP